MISFLFAALFAFYLYYFLERYFVKKSLLRAGEKLSDIIKTSSEFDNENLLNLRKKTEYY